MVSFDLRDDTMLIVQHGPAQTSDFTSSASNEMVVSSDEPSPRHVGRLGGWPPAVWVLIFGVLGAHAFAFWAYGATFWIDSLSYLAVGDALWSPARMREFYLGSGGWFYQHVQPATPLFWSMLSTLPTACRWPVMAGCQHLCGAAAMIVAMSSAYRRWPSVWVILVALFVCLLPFYQALYQAVLTEAFSAATVALALALLVALDAKWSSSRWKCLLLLVVIATQLRAYLGLMILGPVLLMMFRHRVFTKRAMTQLAFACVAAALPFPIYRWTVTGKFFLPRGGGLHNLVLASQADGSPSPSVSETFAAVPWPATFTRADALARGITWQDAYALGQHWQSLGYSAHQIDRSAEMLARALQRDHGSLWQQRIVFAASGCGLTFPAKFFPNQKSFAVGLNASQYGDHVQQGYLFHSRLQSGSYQEKFNGLFRPKVPILNFLPHPHELENEFIDTTERWLVDRPRWIIDPLHIGTLPPDCWAIPGLIAIIAMCGFRASLGFSFLLMVATNAAVLASTPLGGARYSYCLIPVYAVAVSIVGARVFNRRP